MQQLTQRILANVAYLPGGAPIAAKALLHLGVGRLSVVVQRGEVIASNGAMQRMRSV